MKDVDCFKPGWEKKIISELEVKFNTKLGYKFEDVLMWCKAILTPEVISSFNEKYEFKTTSDIGVSTEVVVAPSLTERQSPLWIGEPSSFFGVEPRKKEIVSLQSPSLIRYKLESIHVFQLGSLGPVFINQDCAIITDISTPFVALLPYLNLDLFNYLNGDAVIHGTQGVCLFDRFWEANYAHWLLDVMPRGMSFENSDVDRLVTEIRFNWQTSMLELFGHGENLVSMNPGQVYFYSELYTYNDTGQKVNHPCVKSSPEIVKYLGAVGDTNSENISKKALIVIRKENRKLLNLDGLIEIFLEKNYSVSIVDPSTISVSEQASFFSSHSVVVATHGAALASSVFMRKSAMLIELLPNSYCNPAFWMICSAIGVRYMGVTDLTDCDVGEVRPRLRNFYINKDALLKISSELTIQ